MVTVRRKHSKQRDAILEVIRSTTSHPSAQWVYEQLKPRLPGLSLGTVYRNITLFKKEGALVPVGVVEGEERLDADISPHAHLVCIRCGRVMDLPGELQSELNTRLSIEIPGFSIDKGRTVFHGLCNHCVE